MVNGQQVYVATKDLIGISTQKVSLGASGEFVGVGNTARLLFFTNVGTGDTHSFEANYDLNSQLKKERDNYHH